MRWLLLLGLSLHHTIPDVSLDSLGTQDHVVENALRQCFGSFSEHTAGMPCLRFCSFGSVTAYTFDGFYFLPSNAVKAARAVALQIMEYGAHSCAIHTPGLEIFDDGF